MKTIVAGSRTIGEFMVVNYALQQCPWTISEIVSGRARGVDSLGEEWANRNRVPVKFFPADWDRFGRSAGYRRNAEMAEYADALVAVWDGESKGTGHMIDLAKRNGLQVMIYNTSNGSVTNYSD
jgi:glycerophosphoryl diester phosphodiesterase